jgi:hypothetical protein
MEIVFILLWKMRQDIEFQKQRALMQAQLAQKGAESKFILEAFEQLREAFFPFDKNQKKDENNRMREQLLKEIGRGPLAVTVLEDPNRRKVASRLVKGQADLAQKREMSEQGKTVNIDAFDRARKRPRVS